MAVAGVKFGKEVVKAGKEVATEMLTAPAVKSELYDLPKEQAAAAALTKSEGFTAMSIDGKTAELKTFFSNQDVLYQQSYDKLQEQADATFREIGGVSPSLQLVQQQMQMNHDIQAMYDAAKQQSAHFRRELVQTVFKEDIATEVQQKNAEQLKAYDDRLEALHKEAPKALRENLIHKLNIAGAQQIEERTLEIQKTHFPEYSPVTQEKNGPEL